MKKALLILSVTLALAAGSYLLSPSWFNGNCKHVKGKVSAVYSRAKVPYALRIEGVKLNFYIGQQASKRFTSAALRALLLGKDVSISYQQNRLALDASPVSNITQLSVDQQVIIREP